MIKKKELDLNNLVKASLDKAFVQHGLLKEASQTGEEEKPYEVKGELTAINVKFDPKQWQTKRYNPTPEDLGYFTSKLREIANIPARQVSVGDFNTIINTLNRILGFQVDPERNVIVQSGTGAANVNEAVTALYVASTINTIISKFDAQAAGRVWESFIANLLLGTTPMRGKVAPIQDIYDEAGNYVSLKLLRAGGAHTGSKKNLALGITKSRTGKVIYVAAEKSSNADPFKVDLYSFEVTKENYFNFISNQEEAFANGELVGSAREFVELYLEKPVSKKEKVVTPKKPKEEFSVDDLYIKKFKEQNKGATEKDVEKFIFDKKQEFKKEIGELANAFSKDAKKLQAYKKLFSKYINPENESIIKFPGQVGPEGKKSEKYSKTIDLSSGENFKNSMVNFWLWGDDTKDKLFKLSAYSEFINGMIQKGLPYEDIDPSEELEKAIQYVNMYEFSQEAPDNEKTKLKTEHNRLLGQIQQIINSSNQQSRKQELTEKFIGKPFNILLQEISKVDASSSPLEEIKSAIFDSYGIRKNFYQEIHNVISKKLLELFGPFLDWYRTETGQQSQSLRQASAEKIAKSKTSYAETDLVKNFWAKIALESPEDEQESTNEGLILEAGPAAKESRFKITKQAIINIAEVTEYLPIIISKIQTKSIASKNAQMFKEYIEPYNEAFKKISFGTNRYFVKDEIDGLADVNDGISSLQTAIKKFEGEGGKARKASELKESKLHELLNLTHEAAIVMEMLQKLED